MSPLAMAQSRWVARQIEKHSEEIQVELVGMKTQGDHIQDIPLSQIEGKEFFVAELDRALAKGEVDLNVHSMKDLSLERPKEFQCAAIPVREDPRDVILFHSSILDRIREKKTLKIGTSAPRRIENIPAFLESALPRFSPSETPQLEFVEIRGNINTRLGRVHEPVDSERYVDGVVLALAGLNRLWQDSEGQPELKRLLDPLRWMVLPLDECPTAPAQGALAVECRSDAPETFAAIQKIHDASTAEQVEQERALLREWGGGCHQRFGATCFEAPHIGSVLIARGKKMNGSSAEMYRWNAPPVLQSPSLEWNGMEWRRQMIERPTDIKIKEKSLKEEAIFIAHSRALPKGFLLSRKRVWTSGVKSWFRLAREGIWVEGCSESFGYQYIQPTLSLPVLQLPHPKNWAVLTHQDGLSGWTQGPRGIATYEVQSFMNPADQEELTAALEDSQFIFWGSISQYEALKTFASPQAQHACGPGKTADHLMQQNLSSLKIFPNVQEWKKWLNINS